MDYIKCPSCECVLVRRHGQYGEFVGCSNFPNCTYTANLYDFDEDELKLIKPPIFTGYKGECNRCGQIRTLNQMGLCSSCEEWFERQ